MEEVRRQKVTTLPSVEVVLEEWAKGNNIP